jgi:hypothetical protein
MVVSRQRAAAGLGPVPAPRFAAVLRAFLLGALLAGSAAALVSLLVVEPPLREALAVEESRVAAGDGSDELFGRTTQVIGGMVAVLIAGLVLGAVLAVVFARLRASLPGRSDFGRSLRLAAVGFIVVSLVPALKYPANPPAVGDPDTVGSRTVMYLSFLGAVIAVTALAWALRGRLPRGWRESWRASVLALGLVASYAALILLWPQNPVAVPADMPAELIWQFRLGSLGVLAVLWLGTGTSAGLLLEHAEQRGRVASAA